MGYSNEKGAAAETIQEVLARVGQAPSAFAELAEAYLREGLAHKAVEACQRGLASYPDKVAGRLALGRALIALGRYKEAQAELLKLVKVDRQNHEGFILLGEVLLHRGDFERARMILEHSYDLHPTHGRVAELLLYARTSQRPPLPGEIREPTLPGATPTPFLEDGATQRRKRLEAVWQQLEEPLEDSGRRESSAPSSPAVPAENLVVAEEPVPPPRADASPGRAEQRTARLTPHDRQRMGALVQAGPRPADVSPSPATLAPSDSGPTPSNIRRGASPAGSPILPGMVRPMFPPDQRKRPTLTHGPQEMARARHKRHLGVLMAMAVLIFSVIGGLYSWRTRRGRLVAQHERTAARLGRLGTLEAYRGAREEERAILALRPGDVRAAAEAAALNALSMIDYGDVTKGETESVLSEAESHGDRGDKGAEAGLDVARAALALEQGLTDPVRDLLVKAQVAGVDDVRLAYIGGCARASLGDAAGARDQFMAITRREATYGPALAALAAAYFDLGDLDRADEGYRKLLALSPEHPRAVLGRALLRIDRGQELDLATRDLTVTLVKAAEGSPILSAWRKLALAELALRRGEADPADRELEALQSAPLDERSFLLRLARARIEESRPDQADKLRERLVRRCEPYDLQVRTLEAELALARGSEERVRELLQNLQAAPPRARVTLGRAQYGLGQYAEAATSLEAALRDMPGDVTTRVFRALVRAGQGDRRGAMRDLEALARPKSSPLPLYALGKVALDQGDLDRARAWLADAQAGHPEAGRAAILLAKLDERQGKAGDAVSVLERAVKQDPPFLPAHAALGILDADLGRWHSARTELLLASGEGKVSPELWLALARAHIGQGQVEEAAKDLEHLGKEVPAQLKLQLELLHAVLASYRSDQAVGAAKHIEALRAKMPREPRVLVDAAEAWARAGRSKASETALRAALKADPTEVEALLALGRLRLLLLDPTKAVAAFRDAEAAIEKRPYLGDEKRIEVKFGLARALELPGPMRSMPKARKVLEEAADLGPNDPAPHVVLGRFCLAALDWACAREQLERASRLDPKLPEAHFYLAEAWRAGQDGEAERAKRAYERYLELAPKGEHVRAATRALRSLQ